MFKGYIVIITLFTNGLNDQKMERLYRNQILEEPGEMCSNDFY